MSRSFIVRNALQLARREQRALAGLPPARSGSPGIARRALLKAMGAGAGLTMLPLGACRAATTSPRVAVIGGGLAGLSALHHLAGAGIDAHLYEASRRIGGRVFTRTDFPGSTTWVEMGGQLVNSDHADMLALTEHFGLPLIDGSELGGIDQVIRDGVAVAEAQLAHDLAGIAAQIAADSELLDADWEAHMPALDALSAAEYLDRHAALIGNPVARRLLEQTIRSEYGAEPAGASALQLVFNLPTVDGEAYEVLGNSDERFVIDGGSQRLTDALAEAHVDRITHSRQLTALAPTDSGGVALRFADGSSESADTVVLAIPPALLAEVDHGGLLTPEWQAFASEVRLGRNEKLNAAYSARPWTQTMGAWGASWDTSDAARFVEVWDATAGDDAAGAVLTWFFGGDQVARMDDPSLRATVEAAMGDAMGDLAAATMPQSARTGWSTAPFARGAYVNFAPGQFTRFGGLLWLEEEDGSASQVARSGPILFAGEHVSDAFPGYMNGAAQTGRLAAQAIMAEVAAV